MDNCIFCKIVEGEIPCFKIHEDENYLAFLDISQFEEGHTLVVPKKHYHFVWDDPNFGGYFEFAQKIALHYKKLGFEFIDSITMGRGVPHAHIHLVPHNGKGDWMNVLSGLDKLTENKSRFLDSEQGNKIVEKFKL